ncbi:hypothetical protein BG004_001774 [Podila humilis]|nr:hypothetical protein BG004_001774 [Podila humilis]
MIFYFRFAFAVIGLFATVVKLSLSLFVGATLVFYVKYSSDKYASSVRWTRTGGLREMVELLWHTCRLVPKRSTIALVYALVLGICTLGVSTGLTALVSRVDWEGGSTFSRAITAHLNSYDLVFWTAYKRPEVTVKDSFSMMLNDTYRNPNPAPRTRYTPRPFAYETGCNESNVMLTKNLSSAIIMSTPITNCKTHAIILSSVNFDWDPKDALPRKIDRTTSMVVVPAKKISDTRMYDTIQPYFATLAGNHSCNRFLFPDGMIYMSPVFPEDGVLALPATHATKCRDGAKGSMVLSLTYFQFAVNHIQDFDNITASILLDPVELPLLKPMSNAINEGVFGAPTNNMTLVILSKVPSSASDVDFLICLSRDRGSKGGMGLFCTYMLISVMIVMPQPMDTTIGADLGRDPSTWNTNSRLDFTIVHLPHTLDSEGNQYKTPMFSSAQIIQATANATRYMASLGHNIQLYKDPVSNVDQLYVLYDAVPLEDGYQVSTAALATVCTLSVLFLIIFGFSEKFYETVYNSSIYKTIYKELKSKDESTQMMMDCTQEPLTFNDRQVVPDPGEQPPVTPTRSSQDNNPLESPMQPDDISSQQHEVVPMATLNQGPAQSPFLGTWSIATASTPNHESQPH